MTALQEAARELARVLDTNEISAMEFYRQLQELCPGYRVYFEDIVRYLVACPELKLNNVQLAEKLKSVSRPFAELDKKRSVRQPNTPKKKPRDLKNAQKKYGRRKGVPITNQSQGAAWTLRVIQLPSESEVAPGKRHPSSQWKVTRPNSDKEITKCHHGVQSDRPCPQCQIERLVKDKGDWETD